jgi:hypothetical protein
VLAACCAAFGVLLWVAAIALQPAPANAGDVNIPYIQARLLGIVIGGASITAGIILIAAG